MYLSPRLPHRAAAHSSESPAWVASEVPGRYALGACNRGLPLTGLRTASGEAACSGSCHEPDDDF